MDTDTTTDPGPMAQPLEPKPGLIERILYNRVFSYAFLISLLVYLLLCGYVLVFSGSLFVEALKNKWYLASASEFDSDSFLLGYLYGFPSLLGVFGGLAVLSSKPYRWFRIKVLLFFPSFFWSVLLVLDILRWGIRYWTQWLYLMPIMLLCSFVFLGVVKQAEMPYRLLTKPETAK
jgi:hypothetical protein